MKKVLILTSLSNPIRRQLPIDGYWVTEKYEFLISEEYSEDFDFLVILDDFYKVVNINCPKNKIVLFTGEPPAVKIYPQKYLDQFGTVFTCQKNILRKKNAYLSIPPLAWMTGCGFLENSHIFDNKEFLNFEDFLKSSNHERLNKICIITSNKRFTKGHRNRVDFAIKLKKVFPEKVDIFGNGFMNISDKFIIQSKYKYSIVIENSSYTNYWTEKLADTYLAGSFPIYYGAPNIENYFSETEIKEINIKDLKSSIRIIEDILDNNLYDRSIEALNQAKKKVLYNYNMFSVITSCLDQVKQDISTERVLKFNPIHFSVWDSIRQKIARAF